MFSSDRESHTAFQHFENASLTLKLTVFAKAIIYIVQEICQGQARPLAAKISDVAKYPVPTTKHQLLFPWASRFQ